MFHIQHWRTKIFMGLLDTVVMNACTIYNELFSMQLKEFRESIILNLIEPATCIDLNKEIPINKD